GCRAGGVTLINVANRHEGPVANCAGPSIDFYHHNLCRLRTDVAAAVLYRTFVPEDVPGAAVHGRGLTVGGFHARGQRSQEYDGAARAHMLVPLFVSAGFERGAVDTHLRILEDELVAGGIDDDRVELAVAFRRGG